MLDQLAKEVSAHCSHDYNSSTSPLDLIPDGSKAGSGEVPAGTSTHGSSIISARKTPTQGFTDVLQSLIMHKAGGRRTVGGPSTPIRSQTSIRNFLGKEVIVN